MSVQIYPQEEEQYLLAGLGPEVINLQYSNQCIIIYIVQKTQAEPSVCCE